MNKWIKFGVTSMVVVAGANTPSLELAGPIWSQRNLQEAMELDAVDLAGGSKLKDRMIILADYEMEQAYEMLQG